MLYTPTGTDLPEDVRRRSVRPLAYRQPGFDDAFDDTTLFYDAVRSGDWVVLLGPPLHTDAAEYEAARITALPTGVRCTFEIRVMDLHAQLWVAAPPSATALELDTSFGRFVVPIQAPLTGIFRDRNVLLTMSRDNDPVWIEDWVRFHRDVHGADSVLIYDNGSTAYTAANLLDRLGALEGIREAVVVSWRYKYGPVGLRVEGHWDSNFGQPGGLEHARRLFLHEAGAVMNGDVDELVQSAAGLSVFDAARRSRWGVLRYRGTWMPPTDRSATDALGPPRHRDFTYALRTESEWNRWPPRRLTNRCPPKWTVVPRRCPSSAQWHIHRIKGWAAGALVTSRFSYRHFRQLSTNWHYDRESPERFDVRRHSLDERLIRDYATVDWSG